VVNSRRAFLRTAGAGLAAGSSVLLTACGGSGAKKLVAGSESVEVRESDVSVMNGVLDLEHTAIAAYTAGIPLLGGRALAAGTRFLAQELAHATALQGLIMGAGGKPNLPRASYDLGNPRGQADVLSMLSTIEGSLVEAYLDAIPKLSPGWLRAEAAGILANEGQHIAVLRAARGEPPVPSAFVTSSE
jgi:bacterioferritin (cytochrome b1)